MQLTAGAGVQLGALGLTFAQLSLGLTVGLTFRAAYTSTSSTTGAPILALYANTTAYMALYAMYDPTWSMLLYWKVSANAGCSASTLPGTYLGLWPSNNGAVLDGLQTLSFFFAVPVSTGTTASIGVNGLSLGTLYDPAGCTAKLLATSPTLTLQLFGSFPALWSGMAAQAPLAATVMDVQLHTGQLASSAPSEVRTGVIAGVG